MRVEQRARLTRGALAAALAIVGTTAGCSGEEEPVAEITTTTTAPVTAAPETTTTTLATTTTSRPLPDLGTVLIQGTDVFDTALCRPGGSGTIEISNAYLLDAGAILLECRAFNSGTTEYLVLDPSGGVRARVPVQSGDGGLVGQSGLYIFSETTVPATALESAHLEHTVRSISLIDGSERWSAPFEDFVSADHRSSLSEGVYLVESRSFDPAHPEVLYLGHDGSTLFDASSGEAIWTSTFDYGTPAAGAYVGFGVVVQSSSEGRTGVDPRTNERLWSVAVPDIALGQPDLLTDDGTLWEFGDLGMFGLDLRSGAIVRRVDLESGTRIFTPNSFVAYDGATLHAFRADDPLRPLWETATDRADLLALSDDALVFQGPRSVVMLDMRDGTVAAELSPSEHGPFGQQYQLRDGFLLLPDLSLVRAAPAD